LPPREDLAQCYQAKVIFLQVVEPSPLIFEPSAVYPLFDQEELERWTKEAETYSAARQGEFRDKGIDTRTYVGHGPIVAEIIDAAEREGADLIAMASHGRTGLAQVFYGNVAAGILHRVDRPLLLVRSSSDE
jgi:nucleotide-binding universal stress UspA family protein